MKKPFNSSLGGYTFRVDVLSCTYHCQSVQRTAHVFIAADSFSGATST